MDGAPDFEVCDAAKVFGEVGKVVNTREARSLWNRLFSEIEKNGVSGAISYLEGEFQRIYGELDRELLRLGENEKS